MPKLFSRIEYFVWRREKKVDCIHVYGLLNVAGCIGIGRGLGSLNVDGCMWIGRGLGS